VQLSTRSLRYYKNHYHSICYLTRPISAIPLYAVQSVSNYEIENQDYKRRDKHLYSYMFEVVLVQDYEDIFFFRDYEINAGSSSGGSPNGSRAVSRGTSQSPHRVRLSRSQLGSPERAHSRSSVHSPTKSKAKVTRIVQGHLMPIRDLNKGVPKNHYLEDQSNSP